MDSQVASPKLTARDKLYNLLSERKLYTLSREEFDQQFSNPENRKLLHENLVEDKIYTKPLVDFEDQFFGDLKKKEFTGAPLGAGQAGPEQFAPSSPGSLASEADQLAAQPETATPQLDQAQREALAQAVAPQPANQFEKDFQETQERVMRQNLGIDEKPVTALEAMSNVAGAFNEPIVSLFSSIPKLGGFVRKGVDEVLYGQSKPVQAYDLYKAGTWIDEKAKEIGVTATDPRFQDSFWASKVPAALGSAIGLIATQGRGALQVTKALPELSGKSVLNKAIAETSKQLTSRTAMAGANLMGIQEFEAAKKAGLPDSEAFGVYLQNLGVGTTEVIPLSRALSRINEYTGGQILQVLKAGIKGGFEEGIQEGVQQYLTNKIAAGTYDPAREPFKDLMDQMGAGMFVGFVLPGILSAGSRMTVKQKQATQQIIGQILSTPSSGQTSTESSIVAPERDLGQAQDEAVIPVQEPPVVKPQPTIIEQDESTTEPKPEETLVSQKPKEEKPVEAAEGKEVEPHKEVKANKSVVIKEIAPRFKLKEMEAGMLHNLAGKEIVQSDYFEGDKPIGLRGAFLKKMEDAGYVEKIGTKDKVSLKTQADYVLTDKAKEFISAVDARLQTRKQVKTGIDLFPEDANIPEFVPVLKELKDKANESTINNFKQRRDEQIEKSESIVKNIERKAESADEAELNEAIEEADNLIEEQTTEDNEPDEETVSEPSGERYALGDRVKFEWLGGDYKGTVLGIDPDTGKYRIRADHGTVYKIPSAQTSKESAAPSRKKKSIRESVTDLSKAVDEIAGRSIPPSEIPSDPKLVTINILPLKLLKDVWVGFNKVQNQMLAPLIRKAEDAIAKVAARGLKDEHYAVRNAAGTAQNLIGGLAYTHGDLKNKLNHIGNRNYGHLKAKLLADDLYTMIGSDPTSLELVHRALDPKTWLEFTQEGQVALNEKNKLEDQLKTARKELTEARNESTPNPKDITSKQNIVNGLQDKLDQSETELSGLATKLGQDTYNQLSQSEKNLYDILRAENDFIHEWFHDKGLIDDQTYQEHKGTYIARLYEDFELTPPDVEQTYQGTRPDFNIFKKRKDFDKVNQNLLRDPVYATAKRVSQMLQIEALFEYADAISNSSDIHVSDQPFAGSIQLGTKTGKPFYGSLTGKYVPNHIAMDFKGFFFANKMMNDLYGSFKGYDKLWVRQFLKRLHTIYNPLVQLGNKTANYSFAIWAGVDPFTFTVNKFRAAQEIKSHGAYFQELLQAGILGTDVLTTDLAPAKQPTTQATSKLQQLADKAAQYYGRADDEAKLSAYISLREDYGYSREQALEKVYESFQNYATVGKLYDFASKTPILGNPYIKFKADLARIIKNGVTRQPLTMAAYLIMLKLLGNLLSDESEEDDVIQQIRERRPFIPKIPTPFGDVPLVWQIPYVGEVNFARFISPFYVYDKGDKDDMVSDITDWLPYQFETVPGFISKDTKVVIPEFGDVLLGVYAQVAFDKDFRGKSIRDPQGNKFLTRETEASNQIFNMMNYIARSQVPMYASAADMYRAYNGEADYYGRERTITQAILNNIIKVQEFGSEQARESLAKEIRYRVAKFESLSRDVSALKTNAKGELLRIQNSDASEERKAERSKKELEHLMQSIKNKMEEQIEVLKDLEEPARLLKQLEYVEEREK